MRKNIIQNAYASVKIRTRIAAFLICATVIPIICIFLAAFFGVNQMNDEFAKNHAKSGQIAAEYNLEKFVERINLSYINLLSNDEFFRNLENLYNSKGGLSEINTLLANEITDYIRDIDIIGNDGKYYRCLSQNRVNILDARQIKTFMNEDSNWKETITDEKGIYYFILSKNLVDVYTGKREGSIVFYISESDICSTFSSIKTGGDNAFLIDENNRIISGNVKEEIGSISSYSSIEEDTLIKVSFGDERYFVSKHKMLSEKFDFPTNFTLIETISCEYVDRILNTMIFYLIAAVAAVLIISPFLAAFLSKKALDTVTALQTKMLKFSNGEEIEMGKSGKAVDEISMLEENFDDMVVRIKELISRNNIEKEKQRVAELNALQAQINPHFIYNTLDSISWLAQMNGQRDIVEMVQALSSFFRISLHNGERYVTVAQELTHVKSYLAVEEFRYPDEFEVEFNIQDGIENELILKIILQPIVENSIKHGIRALDKKGKININVYSDCDDIVFEVRDNGVGFDVNNTPPSRHNGGYGLKNVASRIKMEYGEGYGISIESEIGKGTFVKMRIKRNNVF